MSKITEVPREIFQLLGYFDQLPERWQSFILAHVEAWNDSAAEMINNTDFLKREKSTNEQPREIPPGKL